MAAAAAWRHWQAARDLLTEMNAPEGDCSFCLSQLSPPPSAVNEAEAAAAAANDDVVKLGECFHCFHRACFRAWSYWLLAQQQQAPSDEPSGIGHQEALQQSAPDCSDNDELVRQPARHPARRRTIENVTVAAKAPADLACPVCRAGIAPDDLSRLAAQMDAAAINTSGIIWGGVKEIKEVMPDEACSEAEGRRRAAYDAILATQHARGGIIEPRRHDCSSSRSSGGEEASMGGLIVVSTATDFGGAVEAATAATGLAIGNASDCLAVGSPSRNDQPGSPPAAAPQRHRLGVERSRPAHRQQMQQRTLRRGSRA
eukprot:SM000026S08958  [mRNA]  locus=s26:704723:706204:+ [translate_table: standard]